MLHQNIGEVVLYDRNCCLVVFRKQAANGEVFGIIKRRRLGMLKAPIAEREPRPLDIEIFVERGSRHGTTKADDAPLYFAPLVTARADIANTLDVESCIRSDRLSLIDC